MSWTRRLCGLLLAVVAASGAAAGEDRQGSWELGPYAGYGFLDDYDALRPDDDVLFGFRVGRWFTEHASAELSLQRLETETDLAGVDLDLDSYRVNYLWNFASSGTVRPFFTVGVGLESADAGGPASDDLGLNVGGGVRWALGDRLSLRFDGRVVSADVGNTIDASQTNLEATMGLLWRLGGGGPTDSDGDRVSDDKDKCPGTPRGTVVNASGCPKDKDSDGDGVADAQDKCPGTPRGTTVDASGCPKDSDGDGVSDDKDKCPGTPRGTVVNASGCPKDKDSDGDGVADAQDKCPGTPRGTTVDASGCPKDSDGDGVADDKDKCPGTPSGTTVDASGCPKDSDGDGVADAQDKCPGTPAGSTVDGRGCVVLPEKKATLVLEGVYFETNSTHLKPESTATLDRVATALSDHAEVTVEILGHTDSRGSDSLNQKLSEGRAVSVRDYLASKGISASRLKTRGHGEAKPIASNDTDAGRAQNRRVELTRID